MKFQLLDFKIHEVNEMVHVKFVIKTENDEVTHDAMLCYENKEDVALLQAVETFVNVKVGED